MAKFVSKNRGEMNFGVIVRLKIPHRVHIGNGVYGIAPVIKLLLTYAYHYGIIVVR